MSQAQKEGCLEHNHLITSVLQDSRKRPAFLTWLDLKDAYGSVPHEILLKAMELAGLEGTTLRIVEVRHHVPKVVLHRSNQRHMESQDWRKMKNPNVSVNSLLCVGPSTVNLYVHAPWRKVRCVL